MDIIVIKSRRKTLSLTVNDDLNAVVRAPYGTSEKTINDFVRKNEKWLEKATSQKMKQLEKTAFSEDEIRGFVSRAKEIIPQKVEYYSKLMGLEPTGVKITRAKKRFGSCNAKNSLCFSCFLINYPDEAIDYVVVHELAHIRHHNHSRDFYKLVEKYLPDYKKREKMLKG